MAIIIIIKLFLKLLYLIKIFFVRNGGLANLIKLNIWDM